MKLEELQVYQLAMKLGEEVWTIVIRWDFFAKDTIGKQLVRSVDSIASNLVKVLGDTIIMRKNISATTQEDLFLKQRHGSRRLLIENL